MRTLYYNITILVLLVVSLVSTVAANSNPVVSKMICFDASRPVSRYVGQGYNTINFRLVGRGGVLSVETGKDAGLAICDESGVNPFSRWFKTGC